MSKVVNRTPYNYMELPREGEVNNKPSMTVPDQVMSLREILRRYASGIPISDVKIPMYDDEDDILDGVNPKTLDLVDIADMREELDQLNELNQRKADLKKAKADKERMDADIQRKAEELFNSRKAVGKDAEASDKNNS